MEDRTKKFRRELIQVLEKTEKYVIITIPAWRSEDAEFGKPDFSRKEFTDEEWDALVVGDRYFAMVNSDSESMCDLEIRDLETNNLTTIDVMSNDYIKENCKSFPVEHFVNEIIRLRTAIKKHQEQSGHNLCWLNDLELWKVIDPNATYPHDKVPGREEFLSQCSRYHESRVQNLPYVEADQKTSAITIDGKRIVS